VDLGCLIPLSVQPQTCSPLTQIKNFLNFCDLHIVLGATVEQCLELLSKVGLNDAFLFLRTYSQLSDGQKYRYRIAKLIESGKQWVAQPRRVPLVSFDMLLYCAMV
jgi:ABC-type ATPase with predicted acetyltransferase domain